MKKLSFLEKLLFIMSKINYYFDKFLYYSVILLDIVTVSFVHIVVFLIFYFALLLGGFFLLLYISHFLLDNELTLMVNFSNPPRYEMYKIDLLKYYTLLDLKKYPVL